MRIHMHSLPLARERPNHARAQHTGARRWHACTHAARHARTLCEYSECRPYLIDLGSTNGSFINGVSTVSDSLAAVALAATPRAQIAVNQYLLWLVNSGPTRGAAVRRVARRRYFERAQATAKFAQSSPLGCCRTRSSVVFNYEDALMRRRLSWTLLGASAIRRENTFSWLPTSE